MVGSETGDAWERAEARRGRMTERVLAMDPEVARRRNHGSLSPAECLGHLARVDRYDLGMLRRFPRRGPARTSSFYRWLIRRMREAKPTPTFAPFVPARTEKTDGMAEEWAAVRADIAREIETGSAVFWYPLFGRLGPAELIDLLDAHAEYHERRM